MSITRTWNYRNNAPPPGNGEVRTDTNVWSTMTLVALSNQDASAIDVSSEIASIQVGTILRLELSSTAWANYTVGTATDSGAGYWNYSVAYVDGAGAPSPGNSPVTALVTYETSVVESAPVAPYIVATIELNQAITLERYDVFLLNLQTFLGSYAHLINDVRYDTSAPTIYTVPVLANAQGMTVDQLRATMEEHLNNIPNVTVSIGDIVDLSNPATPQWRPQPVISAPPSQSRVEPLVTTTAGTENQRQGP